MEFGYVTPQKIEAQQDRTTASSSSASRKTVLQSSATASTTTKAGTKRCDKRRELMRRHSDGNPSAKPVKGLSQTFEAMPVDDDDEGLLPDNSTAPRPAQPGADPGAPQRL